MRIARSFLFLLISVSAFAQIRPEMLSALHWRNIGPFRGGRTRGVAGVPGQPNVFYIGVCNGGVWKTDDYGRTWVPIFDQQDTGSIGAVAVAPSNPSIVYVGSGEGLHRPDLSVGDGMYKSTDAGTTWTHLGLRDAQQIRTIAVDPRDPNRLFVAVAGHPYGPNPERGIFRSTDGGKTFEQILYKDENTGGSDVVLDPSHPDIVYASLWEAREGPWENAAWSGPGGGIFKSTDGGNHWQQLTNGLPKDINQANLALAPSAPNHLLAAVAFGAKTALYRSDDAGQSWYNATTDPRPALRIGGGDLPVPNFDPKNPDVIYSTSIVAWKSTDGGKTWLGWRGAPGGDDYQNIWINPDNPNIILLASDQGAIITVNGGQTWSSWYNQPTAQLYHVGADNAFPYRVCSGQQESGSVCIRTRGNDGEITFREWHPVGAEEYGYVTPDPRNADIVFGGKLSRYDRRTGQAQNILPKPLRSADVRMLRTEPVVFSPFDPRVLYFATNTLWKTSDGGDHWQQISPDLTRKTWPIPASVGKYRSEASAQPAQRGVIYTVAPSPIDANRIWIGTDDGLIYVTPDGGKTWNDVTPPSLVPFAKVSIIDAGQFDAQTAYAAINTIRLDDLRPHIFRTHNGGKTWKEITSGIPADENTNAVREDPRRKGLLYAATERTVRVSFDDGDHWQSLRLNLPATSVRDLIVKNDDLVIATHGRSFWVLDDITPLRQIFPRVEVVLDDNTPPRQLKSEVEAADVYLFDPQIATRVRWNMNTDTPLPPDVPAGENPPDGAVIDYYLKANSSAPVTLEIRDLAGDLVRRYASTDVPPKPENLNIPLYWVRPPQVLSAASGMHRFLWDMHYAPLPGVRPEFPIAAVYRNTAPAATSPWVMPGQYKVVLTVNGRSYTRMLTVHMDPRVTTPEAGLRQQFALSKQVYDDALQLAPALEQAASIRKQLEDLRRRAPQGAIAAPLDAFEKKLNEVAGGETGRRGGGLAGPGPRSLGAMRGALLTLLGILQDADVPPTSQATAAVADLHQQAPAVLERWRNFERQEVPALNQQLRGAGLPELRP